MGAGVGVELPLFDRNRGGVAEAEQLREATRERLSNSLLRLSHAEAQARAEWRANDSLVYVNGVRTAERHALEEAGVGTMASLAAVPADSVPDLAPDRLESLGRQSGLQVAARAPPDDKPPFRLLDPAAQGKLGLAALPAPRKMLACAKMPRPGIELGTFRSSV